VRRHANFSAWYSFHPAQNGKIFQQRLIDFIHTNAMNPFSKLTNGEKAMKNRYRLFIVFSKNRASPCQLFSFIFVLSSSICFRLWLAKVCPERENCAFSETFWIRPKTGFLTHNFGYRYANKQVCGSGSWKWKRSFFCGSGSAKILPLPHRLSNLESNLAKKFCPFPNVD